MNMVSYLESILSRGLKVVWAFGLISSTILKNELIRKLPTEICFYFNKRNKMTDWHQAKSKQQ